jgi:hypothetical protein
MKWLVPVVICVVFFLTGFFVLTIFLPNVRVVSQLSSGGDDWFDQDEWRSHPENTGETTVRSEMAQDALGALSKGMERRTVLGLLGKPTESRMASDKPRGHRDVYKLSRSAKLIIRYDEKDLLFGCVSE